MRKETITILDDGGQPLKVRFKAMSAIKLYDFSNRLLLLLAGLGFKHESGGPLNLADFGDFLSKNGLEMFGRLDYEKVKPLADELLSCCTRLVDNPNGSITEQPCTLQMMDGFINDFRTIYKLQREALTVNYDFLFKGADNPLNSHAEPHSAKPDG